MSRSTALAAAALALVVVVPSPAHADEVGAKVTISRNADVGEHPSQVALLDVGVPAPMDARFCGGTLIHPEWVLTAAHCVELGYLPDVLLRTTSLLSGGTRVATIENRSHPQYNGTADDIALLRLAEPQPGPYARLAYDGLEVLEAPGGAAIVTGWGGLLEWQEGDEQQFPSELQEGDVPVISDADCAAALAEYGVVLADAAGQVCAGAGRSTSSTGEADACHGDSGGPLWITGPDGSQRQIGLVGGGPTCGFSPTYYTSIERYIGFIETMTAQHFASFPDIPTDVHEVNIERIVLAGFAGGLGDGTFAPGAIVSRGQMATFLARALGLAPVATGPFTDVAGTPHEQNINAVAQAGVAGGFDDGTFKPGELVTRDQMATFLARALQLAPVAEARFSDTAGNVHEQNINAVAEAGVAGGFPDGTYLPRNGVTRGQMATFVARAFLDR